MELPETRSDRGGALLRVRAVPGAAREGVAGIHGGALKVSVTAPPEKGKANRALVRAVARALELRPAQVTLHSGATSRDKWLRIEGTTEAELRQAVERALER